MKDIDKIIFNILKNNHSTWVRFFDVKEISGLTMPGYYVEIRSNILFHSTFEELIQLGFRIEQINSLKINADIVCEVLLKKEL